MDFNLEQFKQTFFQECEELLQGMEEGLMALAEDSADGETLHAVFRAVHSVKGGAGAFGFDQLVGFAHVFETVLDHLRDGRLAATPAIVAVLLRAGDILSDLVQAARGGDVLPADFGMAVKAELDQLAGQASGGGEEDEDVLLDFEGIDFAPVSFAPTEDTPAEHESPDYSFDGIDFTPVPVDIGDDPYHASGGRAPGAAQAQTPLGLDTEPARKSPPARMTYRIRFAPEAGLLRNANEPLLLLRELARLGPLDVEADLSRLPALAELDPNGAYLAWTCRLTTTADRAAIEEVFEFVLDECSLTIDNAEDQGGPGDGGKSPAPPPAPVLAPAPPVPLAQPAASGQGTMLKPAARRDLAVATPPQISIRVDLDKVDRLVNMVGELVITRAMLSEKVGKLPHEYSSIISRELEELAHYTRDLQESVMSIRAQPVKSVFQRMPRLVRELAAQTGKQVAIVMSGENTEIDKTVIEQLGDPLTHMIRNSVDHGIETPDERRAAGKPPEGTIHLSADHRGGRIVIRLEDDGRGINRPRVLEKAVEKGLVPANAALSDEEIDNLIFAPGFSTAATVSAISGRGVGMDVVKRNIQQLGGRIFIQSTPGAGTCFVLTLPLTLAVLDGMIVSAGGETYVLPLANIIETLRPDPRNLHRLVNSGEVLALRGEYIPLIHLHRLFNLRRAAVETEEGVVAIVETEDAGKVGILVDGLVGQQQVVIKSLETNYDPVEGIAAATILGNGRVALILDVSGLRTMAQRHGPGSRPTPVALPRRAVAS